MDTEHDDNEQETSETKMKHLFWKQMYLRLQADPRLKQNREDLQLLAHLQRL